MFRMTKLTDYGIVILTHFANHDDRGAHTARELAQETRLPLPTVGKLLKQLSHEGLLLSHRGTKGGYTLARPPQEITVAAIIAALEGPLSITECNIPGICEHELFCSVKPNWQVINRTIRTALEGLTLAEMARPMPALWTITGPLALPRSAPRSMSDGAPRSTAP